MVKGRNPSPLQSPLGLVTCIIPEEICLHASLRFLVPKSQPNFGELWGLLDASSVDQSSLLHSHTLEDSFHTWIQRQLGVQTQEALQASSFQIKENPHCRSL